ncbi:hypothetical protein ACE6H2_002551 [Prunus campanulata]
MGELIADPIFSRPFWNWDAPTGMYIPEIFTEFLFYDEKKDLVRVKVARPSTTKRKTEEKSAQYEVLVIKEIEFAGN